MGGKEVSMILGFYEGLLIGINGTFSYMCVHVGKFL